MKTSFFKALIPCGLALSCAPNGDQAPSQRLEAESGRLNRSDTLRYDFGEAQPSSFAHVNLLPGGGFFLHAPAQGKIWWYEKPGRPSVELSLSDFDDDLPYWVQEAGFRFVGQGKAAAFNNEAWLELNLLDTSYQRLAWKDEDFEAWGGKALVAGPRRWVTGVRLPEAFAGQGALPQAKDMLDEPWVFALEGGQLVPTPIKHPVAEMFWQLVFGEGIQVNAMGALPEFKVFDELLVAVVSDYPALFVFSPEKGLLETLDLSDLFRVPQNALALDKDHLQRSCFLRFDAEPDSQSLALVGFDDGGKVFCARLQWPEKRLTLYQDLPEPMPFYLFGQGAFHFLSVREDGFDLIRLQE